MRRRNVLVRLAGVGFLMAVSALAQANDMLVIFGTQRNAPNVGLSIAHFDSDTGVLLPPSLALATPAPAYFVLSADQKFIYSCNAIDTYQGKHSGSVSAYAIDPAAEKITFINSQPSGGADPSYISLDQQGTHALVANYKDGNFEVLKINPDGSVGDRTAFVQDTGKSINPQRQSHAYAHSIRLDPTGRFAIACDLGVDKVFISRYDGNAGTLTAADPPFATVEPGSGARHPVFHPNGKWLYVITEMGSSIVLFDWDAAHGTLTHVQTISSLPAGFKGTSAAAEIQVHPNGKFVYASNRGDNSIGVFAVDPNNGKLSEIQHISTQGRTPRNFTFDPTAKWLLVTNHDSNNGMVFSVDAQSGKLAPQGKPVAIPYPFCERFLPLKMQQKAVDSNPSAPVQK
jgi:6-phosphogluconolactonase